MGIVAIKGKNGPWEPGLCKNVLRLLSVLKLFQEASSNKCIATSNKCLTSSNKKLVVTSASLLVTSALLVVTRSY